MIFFLYNQNQKYSWERDGLLVEFYGYLTNFFIAFLRTNVPMWSNMGPNFFLKKFQKVEKFFKGGKFFNVNRFKMASN